MDAAVDVHDLAADRAGEVGEQEQRRVGDRRGVAAVPAEGRGGAPVLGELVEAGDPAGGGGRNRAGRDQVDAYATRPELAGQVPGDGFEARLGDAHPVVGRPGDRGIEVEADDACAGAGPLRAASSGSSAPTRAFSEKALVSNARSDSRVGSRGSCRREHRRVRTRSRGRRRPPRPSAR